MAEYPSNLAVAGSLALFGSLAAAGASKLYEGYREKSDRRQENRKERNRYEIETGLPKSIEQAQHYVEDATIYLKDCQDHIDQLMGEQNPDRRRIRTDSYYVKSAQSRLNTYQKSLAGYQAEYKRLTGGHYGI